MARLTGAQIKELFAKVAASEGMTPEELEDQVNRPLCRDPLAYTFDDIQAKLRLQVMAPARRVHVTACDDCFKMYQLLGDTYTL